MSIVKQIKLACPKELGTFLETLNRTAHMENDWNTISVKASYAKLKKDIEVEMQQVDMLLAYGNEMSDVRECATGKEYTQDNRQALANLQIALDFLNNPPVVENPNSGGASINVESIDWNKPVLTAEEVRKLLNIGENTFRKWVNGGWISYTQMDGSDKKYIETENLKAFLRNPKIFYPCNK